jgi:type II secretory pathway pseudopilin PulG
VELITVLFVLGVMAGVSGLAVASLRPPTDSARNQRLDQARAAAVRSGKAGSVTLEKGVLVRFLPDGRAIGAGVDPLTGEVVDASQ